jgi:AmpD protein
MRIAPRAAPGGAGRGCGAIPCRVGVPYSAAMLPTAPSVAELHVDAGSGLLREARWLPSPNQDARPPGATLDLIVVHGISLPPGEFGGPWIEHLFLGRLAPHIHPAFADLANMQVSAHLLIRRDGKIIQFVPFHRRAWHAGVSTFQGQARCNDYSIGIELEGTDTLPYTDIQYERLMAVTRALLQAYPAITLDRIVGHCDIAPTRKTDPGPAFDWRRLRSGLAL